MAENLMILHPAGLNDAPDDVDALIEKLQQIEFISRPIDFHGETHYAPGEEFMHLITFLGCSPVVAMGAPGATGDEFGHIAFTPVTEKPTFIAGDNVKEPRCLNCGHRIKDWPEAIEAWQQDPDHYQWQCPECGSQYELPKLRWRKCAGFARFFIKVWGIFESEAVPGDKLKAVLREHTGLEWVHFYLRNN